MGGVAEVGAGGTGMVFAAWPVPWWHITQVTLCQSSSSSLIVGSFCVLSSIVMRCICRAMILFLRSSASHLSAMWQFVHTMPRPRP